MSSASQQARQLPTLASTHGTGLYPLPSSTPASASSSSGSRLPRPDRPRIRTPASVSPSPKRMVFSPSRLPRAVWRTLAFLLAACGAILLVVTSYRSGAAEGDWDATTFLDRQDLVSRGKARGKLPLLNPFGVPNAGGNGYRRPVLSGLPTTSENTTDPEADTVYARPMGRLPSDDQPFHPHPGHSRILKPGKKNEYELGPLPTLEEALAHLEPQLRAVKRKHAAIPSEHMLWEPLFAPFLTQYLKERYRHVRETFNVQADEWQPIARRWYLVTVCRQVTGMLADWFAAWTVLADYLGPESLVFTLLEGSSDDGAGLVISEVMRDHLLFLGVPPDNINIKTNLPSIDWEEHHRIEMLASMRNAGMQPFYDAKVPGAAPDGVPYTGVVWYNDVYLSAGHFLELMHYHLRHDADMTAGWDHAGRYFYDGWVGRDMSGDLYTPFPVKEEDKDRPQVLFPSHPQTKERFLRLLPFQVFAAWNGIVVINPVPFTPPYNVRFRRGAQGNSLTGQTAADAECQQSESSFISWDFWKYGFGRIQVIPGVHACYGKEDAMLRGWVEMPEPSPQVGYPETFWWDANPPAKVRCHDWPDLKGKGWWAWSTVRWVAPPEPQEPGGVIIKPDERL